MKLFCVLGFLFLSYHTYAQKTSPYALFGQVTVADLQQTHYLVDSNANAVVLSDIGRAAIVGNKKWFSLEFTHHKVVHILNKNGYGLADVEIPLYSDGSSEVALVSVKAVSYNLENGKMAETELDKQSIFRNKVNKNLSILKFTMPNVKAGTIIEFEYKTLSDFISYIEPWEFQGVAPRLWSEFVFSVPSFFEYASLWHGFHPLFLQEKKAQNGKLLVSFYNVYSNMSEYRWVMKDVPELKEESFTTTLKNHLSTLELQLTKQLDPLEPHVYVENWLGLINQLIGSDNFGKYLQNIDYEFTPEIKNVLKVSGFDLERAKFVYTYVRDHFYCTGNDGIYTSQPLRELLKSKKGSVSEINLLLTDMLRYTGLNADPVVLSSIDNGYIYDNYPTLRFFNYVVVQVQIEGKKFYLDASNDLLGFGKLAADCYNGMAKLVNPQASPVNLSSDSVEEKEFTSVIIANSEKGKLAGALTRTPGYYASYDIRKEIKEKGETTFREDMKKELGTDVRVNQVSIDSLHNPDVPVTLHCDMELDLEKSDLIYVSPLFGSNYKTNPFKSDERSYPVEMPHTLDDTYLVTMEVPAGYVVDELPKPIVVKLDDEGSALFEYMLNYSGNTVSIRSRVQIRRTLFQPQEYGKLREFFKLVVKKQNEQIVFKKKN